MENIENKYYQGIDVSHHQGKIDWKQVKKSNIHFAIAKVTEGNHFQDTSFLHNWQGMKSNDIQASVYHYVRGA